MSVNKLDMPLSVADKHNQVILNQGEFSYSYNGEWIDTIRQLMNY